MEKLTLFELHFNDAQFGPASIDTGSDETETPEQESTPSSRTGSRVLRLVAASIVFSVVATVLARRFLGNDETMDEMADGEDIELEPIEAE